jgi:hypothetical protein
MVTSAGYTATATGTDYWVATYNGDSNNTPVTSGAASEPVTITSSPPAAKGDTATIGFWHNKNGQKIIDGLGTNTVDGPTETAGQWINAHFPCLLQLWANVSGSPSVADVTTGDQTTDNTKLAAMYLNVFTNGGSPKVLAQIFDTVLTTYATSTDLNHTKGDIALVQSNGFNTSAGGTGSHTVTGADITAAFPSSCLTPNPSNTYTILAIVNAAECVCMEPGFTGFSSAINDVFDNDINSAFDIS